MLTIFSLEQSEQWDAVVRSFAEYDTYWLRMASAFFWISGYFRNFVETVPDTGVLKPCSNTPVPMVHATLKSTVPKTMPIGFGCHWVSPIAVWMKMGCP